MTKFQVGDRVVSDHHYPGSIVEGIQAGIPSNASSRRYRVLHETKILKIPAAMSNEVAAAFSPGAQTCYSIIRKLDVREGTYALVTGATSNTSLFVIQALHRQGVHVYATTTSLQHEQRLLQMGADHVIVVDPNGDDFRAYEPLNEVFLHNLGFNYIFDPFSDVYIGRSVNIIASEGKYITCGFAAGRFPSVAINPLSAEFLRMIVTKNVQIIGNCLGRTDDLQRAIKDYQEGNLDVPIDSVFRGNQIGAFFERTYNSRDRFGKVVYAYSD